MAPVTSTRKKGEGDLYEYSGARNVARHRLRQRNCSTHSVVGSNDISSPKPRAIIIKSTLCHSDRFSPSPIGVSPTALPTVSPHPSASASRSPEPSPPPSSVAASSAPTSTTYWLSETNSIGHRLGPTLSSDTPLTLPTVPWVSIVKQSIVVSFAFLVSVGDEQSIVESLAVVGARRFLTIRFFCQVREQPMAF